MTKNIKVAFFIAQLARGGVARSSINLATAMAKQGVKPEIWTLSCTQSLARELKNLELDHFPVAAKRSATAVVPLARLINSNAPDVLIAVQNHANVAAILASKIARTPCKVVVSEVTAVDIDLERNTPTKRWLLGLAMRRTYDSALAVVANSKDCATRLENFLGWQKGRVRAIYSALDIQTIKHAGGEKLEHPWFEQGATPVVVAVGRLAPEKRLDLLLDAFARARKKTPMRLVFVGAGDLEPELRGRVAELRIAADVEFTGDVNNPFKYIKHAAALVLTSDYEGLPNALIEGQACGTPIVSVDCPTGPREITLDGEAGILVAQTTDAVADGILQAVAGGPKVNQMVTAGTRALTRFKMDTISDQYLSLLNQRNQS